MTNAGMADLTTGVWRKRAGWPIETVFRDRKQFAGREACHWWADVAVVRHIVLVLVTFVVLHILRRSPNEAVGTVTEHWQLALLRAGENPPEPLRACRPELRPTA